MDGNKRTGFVAAQLCWCRDGFRPVASDADGVLTLLAVAAGDRPGADFAALLRPHALARAWAQFTSQTDRESTSNGHL
jgi:death on curing protein